jgi:hypothetical protein
MMPLEVYVNIYIYLMLCTRNDAARAARHWPCIAPPRHDIAAIMILALAALPSLLPGCADFQQSVYLSDCAACVLA